MLIIPSIDILHGKVVRLAKGDFNKVTYYDFEPVEKAKMFESYGFTHLHVVDLIGSKSGDITTLETIKEISRNTELKLQFGGGIRSYANVKLLRENGISRIVIGSMSINNKPEFEKIVKDFGPDSVIVAADTLDGKIRIKGWTEDSGILLTDHIDYCRGLGINVFLCTDISQDGMLEGPSINLYKNLMDEFEGIELIASGGVSTKQNIENLKSINIYAAVVGRAIYENKLDAEELAKIG